MAHDDEVPASVTFIGTATTLLRLGDFTLLTDPNFLHAGQRAYLGYGLWTKRRTDPALGIDQLPGLDGVVLSHLHGDHFDRVARHGLSKAVPIITTPAAQRRLRRWGFAAAEALRTGESHQLRRGDQTLRITAVPGRHGPGLVSHLLPPVMGSILDLEQRGRRRLRLYITGDTLNRPMLAAIPERFPDIDAMLIHLGGTRLLGLLVTMDARQGADLVGLIRPRMTLPVHYDDYPVFRSPLRDFLDAARRRGLASGVHPLRRGETVALPRHADTGVGTATR
ncbi:MBL fold metallo-hydrolase [Plantactinospora sonchi]|uniref:MBL fold metallo-hydrolase n=1 Tax=Plantactinospora sonchi TaxID=1544735 RepID=A0ABU7RKA9_9ACTN